MVLIELYGEGTEVAWREITETSFGFAYADSLEKKMDLRTSGWLRN